MARDSNGYIGLCWGKENISSKGHYEEINVQERDWRTERRHTDQKNYVGRVTRSKVLQRGFSVCSTWTIFCSRRESFKNNSLFLFMLPRPAMSEWGQTYTDFISYWHIFLGNMVKPCSCTEISKSIHVIHFTWWITKTQKKMKIDLNQTVRTNHFPYKASLRPLSHKIDRKMIYWPYYMSRNLHMLSQILQQPFTVDTVPILQRLRESSRKNLPKVI